MIYITHRQFRLLSKKFQYKEIIDCEKKKIDTINNRLSDTSYITNHDYIFYYDSKEIFSVHKKKINNLILLELDILDESYKLLLESFSICETKQICSDHLLAFMESRKGMDYLVNEEITQLISYLDDTSLHEHYLTFNEKYVIKLHTDTVIDKFEIVDYYCNFVNMNINCNEDVILKGMFNNCVLYEKMYSIFHTILYLYELRIINKPVVASEGNGYLFFDIGSYIIGKQKFFGNSGAPLNFIVIDKNKYNYILICEENTKETRRTILRDAQTFISYMNIKDNGINLHGSSIVYKEKYSCVLLGDKLAGKTTNMLFGLTANEYTDIQTNDLVFLYKKGVPYTSGSNRKVTIRQSTVDLFEELSNYDNSGDEYSSKGDYKLKGNYSLVMDVKKVCKLFNKKIVPTSRLGVFLILKYDCNVKGISIKEVEKSQRRYYIENNMHQYYNGLTRYWNDLLPRIDIEIDSSYIDIPMFHINVNQENIHDTWNTILNKLEIILHRLEEEDDEFRC